LPVYLAFWTSPGLLKGMFSYSRQDKAQQVQDNRLLWTVRYKVLTTKFHASGGMKQENIQACVIRDRVLRTFCAGLVNTQDV